MFKGIDWQAIAAQTVILVFVWGILVYLLQPRCKEWVWKVLGSDKSRLRDILQTELALLRKLEDAVSEHTDSLGFIRTAIERQGEELRMLPQVARSMEQMGRSFETMAETLSEIHQEVIDHGKKFERWDGFMEGQDGQWTGTSRRNIKRRKGDPDPK